MPTREVLERFFRDYGKLTAEQRQAFLKALGMFIEGLQTGTFDPSLRVHLVDPARRIWSMSWAGDGRATFHYGAERIKGEPHVVWRRIGSHDIYREP